VLIIYNFQLIEAPVDLIISYKPVRRADELSLEREIKQLKNYSYKFRFSCIEMFKKTNDRGGRRILLL